MSSQGVKGGATQKCTEGFQIVGDADDQCDVPIGGNKFVEKGVYTTAIRKFAQSNFTKFRGNLEAAKSVMSMKCAAALERKRAEKRDERAKNKQHTLRRQDDQERKKSVLDMPSVISAPKKVRARKKQNKKKYNSEEYMLDLRSLKKEISQIAATELFYVETKIDQHALDAFSARVKDTRKEGFYTQAGTTFEYNVLTKEVEKHIGGKRVEFLEWVLTFFDLIMFLESKETKRAKIQVFNMWLRSNGVRYLESSILTLPMRYLLSEKTEVVYKTQGHMISEGLDQIGDVLEYTFDSMFADSLKNVFISLACMKIFDKAFNASVFEWLGTFTHRIPKYDLVRVCIKSVAKVIKVFEDISMGVPIIDAMFAKDSWVHATCKARELLFKKDFLYIGLKVEGKFNRNEWLKDSDEVLQYLKARQKKTSQLKVQYSEISELITKLEAARCGVLNVMNTGYRFMPVGVIIGDDPGIGKSNLVSLIARRWCVVKGMKFRDDLIYHRNMQAEYHDGLDNQPIYHYSEPGTATPAIAKTTPDEAVIELTSVMDSIAKNANMAEAHLKGKVAIRPELVIADTNNMGMNVSSFACNPAAFRRRFIYAKFTVKPEFRKLGGSSCELDGAALAEFMEKNPQMHKLDFYEIDVWIEIAMDPVRTTPKDLLVKGSIWDFVKLLDECFIKHLEREERVAKLRDSGDMFRFGGEVEEDSDSDRSSFVEPGKEAIMGFWGGLSSRTKKFGESWLKKLTKKTTDADDDNYSEVSETEFVAGEALAETDALLEAGDLSFLQSTSRVPNVLLEHFKGLRSIKVEDEKTDSSSFVTQMQWEAEQEEKGSDWTIESDSDEKKFEVDLEEIASLRAPPRAEDGGSLGDYVYQYDTKPDSDINSEASKAYDRHHDAVCRAYEKMEEHPCYDRNISNVISHYVGFSGIWNIVFGRRKKQVNLNPHWGDEYLARKRHGEFANNILPDETKQGWIQKDICDTGLLIRHKGIVYVYFVPNLSAHLPYEYINSYVEHKYARPAYPGPAGVVPEEVAVQLDRDFEISPTVKRLALAKLATPKKPLTLQNYCVGIGQVFWWLLNVIFGMFVIAHDWAVEDQSVLSWVFVLGSHFALIMFSIFVGGFWRVLWVVWILTGFIFKGRTKHMYWRMISYANMLDALLPRWLRISGHLKGILAGVVAVFVAAGTAKIISMVCKQYNVSKTAAASTEGVILTDLEKDSEVNDTVTRVNLSGNDKVWNFMKKPNVKLSHTGDARSLAKKVNRNVRYFKLKNTMRDGTVCRTAGHMLGVKGSYAIVPKHYFKDTVGPWDIQLFTTGGGAREGGSIDIKLEETDLVEIGHDVVIVDLLGHAFVDILQHFVVEDGSPLSKAVIREQDVKASLCTTEKGLHVTSPTGWSYDLQKYYVYTSTLADGDCGWPLVAECGKGAAIVSIHVAGAQYPYKASIGCPIYRGDIIKAIEEPLQVFTQSLSEKDVPTFLSDHDEKLGLLEPPIDKSPVVHESLLNLEYFGKLSGPVLARQKCRLQKSGLSKDINFDNEFIEAFDRYPSILYGKPAMAPVRCDGKWYGPWNNTLKKCNARRYSLRRSILLKSVNRYAGRVITMLHDRGITTLSPVSMKAAINGIPGDEFFRRINVSTSAGFGFKGTKEDYLPIVDGVIRVPTIELETLIESVIETFKRGEYVHFVYSTSLKDEPRALEKCKLAKTRVFYISPLCALILSRMYLSPLYTLMTQFGDVFCTAIGINTHLDGAALLRKLHDFSPYLVEGDYGGYDTSMPIEIGVGANTFIRNVLKALGYNSVAIEMVVALLSEELYPFICMCKDMFGGKGLQMSGKYGTAENNSIRGVLLLLFFWYSQPELSDSDFFDYVLPTVYGDDLVAAVKPSVAKWFNNITYEKFVTEVYNMEYTSAQKSKELQPFVDIDTVTFLKRNCRKHPSFDKYVAPIDYNTIYKMLEWRLPSSVASECEQTVMTIDSALRESFFHLDERRYNRWRDYLLHWFRREFGCSALIERTHFHTFSKMKAQYIDCTEEEDALFDNAVEDFPTEACTESLTVSKDFRSEKTRNIVGIRAVTQHRVLPEEKQQWCASIIDTIQDTLSELQVELKEKSEELSKKPNPLPEMSHHDAKRSIEYCNSNQVRERVDAYFTLKHEVAAIEATIKMLSSALKRHLNNVRFKVESGTIAEETGVASNVEVTQNFRDDGGEAPEEADVGKPLVLSKEAHLDMRGFLERFVYAGTYVVPVAADYNSTINPWSFYFSDPTVVAKLRNFAFIRCDLKVKISLSASQFHFGSFLVAYVPLPLMSDIWQFYKGAGSGYRFQKLQWLSQLPGAAIMRIGDNKPLELDIPYINFTPATRLWTNSISATSPPTATMANFGDLVVMSLNQPTSVNSTAPTSLSYDVYVHATNINLGCPTGAEVTIVTESKYLDERKSGPIERAASDMAGVADAMSVIPMIAPYAQASSKVFKAIKLVAALYGFSVPAVLPHLSGVQHIRNDAYQNAATTITRFAGKKLAFDPMQQITVDPRVGAVQEDELAIASFCKNKSLLYTFSWPESATALSTLLWQCAVHPMANTVGPIFSSNAFIQPTAMAYAVRNFAVWRGDITYTFYIAKSIFHKGKLAIMFDPVISQNAIITSSLHLNKQEILVVDLQDTDEFSITIKFAFPAMWCNVAGEQLSNQSHGPTLFSSLSPTTFINFVTGIITVYPFTALQSPDASPVAINVFVHSDNMRVNRFWANTNLIRASTQSKILDDSGSNFVMGDAMTDGSHASMLHFGEEPVSYRSYLKRYETCKTTQLNFVGATVGTYAATTLNIPDISNKFGVTSVTGTYTLLDYLRYAFLCMRGGVRKRYQIVGWVPSATDRAFTTIPTPGTTASAFGASTSLVSTSNGSTIFVPVTNGGWEVELPFYNNNLFVPASVGSVGGWSVAGTDYQFSHSDYMTSGIQLSASSTITFSEDIAVGEDFTLFRRLGVPPYRTGTF